MNRRGFIKTITTTALAGLAAIFLPGFTNSIFHTKPQAYLKSQALSRIFRGTANGRLQETLDSGGINWKPIANFGSQCAIVAIYERGTNLYLEVGIQQYRFFLTSTDARVWRTTNLIPQA